MYRIWKHTLRFHDKDRIVNEAPLTYKEATDGNERDRQRKAIQDELALINIKHANGGVYYSEEETLPVN